MPLPPYAVEGDCWPPPPLTKQTFLTSDGELPGAYSSPAHRSQLPESSTRCPAGKILRISLRGCRVDPHVVNHGRLQPAEAEVIGILPDGGSWKSHRLRIPCFGKHVNDRPPGVTQSQEFGNFVKGLACRIIPGLPQAACIFQNRPLERATYGLRMTTNPTNGNGGGSFSRKIAERWPSM